MAQTLPNLLPNILEKPSKYTCMNCRIEFESAVLQRAHFKTEWHLYNLKRKVCNLESIDQDSFNQIQQLTPATQKSDSDDDMLSLRLRLDSSSMDQPEDPIIEISDSDLDSNWEELNEDELLDEDYDDAEAAELLAKIVPENVCLFCTKRSLDVKASIKHMETAHGFFIPEEQYLIDLDGLVEYLGFKVGAGATCLWCDRQFTTLHGVRLHMLDKGHCRIRYDQVKAIEEFKDFYDYSDQIEIPMKPLDEIVSSKKRPSRPTETSLVLKHKLSTNQARLQLLNRQNPLIIAGTIQSKSIKKFNAKRAKILLRVGLINNNAIRSRFRRRNPI